MYAYYMGGGQWFGVNGNPLRLEAPLSLAEDRAT